MAPVRVRNGRFLLSAMTELTKKGMDAPEEQVRLAEEAIAATDLFLVDVEVRGRDGSRVVEVYLDGDAGVGIDELAEISRQLAFLLDTENIIPGKYSLNVSSPGSERALKYPRQYRRHEGRKVEIETRSGSAEEVVTETGELVSSSDVDVELRLPGGEHRRIPFTEVERARIVMPW